MDNDETDGGTNKGADARGVDAAMAASLLRSGEQIGVKVYRSIDFRTQALVQAGTAVAIFLYVTVFLFLISTQGDHMAESAAPGSNNFGTNLLIPFLALSYLTLGVRERLKALLPTHRRARAFVVGLLSIVPFLVVGGAAVFGQQIPWGLTLAVACCAAAPAVALAIFSARQARHHDVRPSEPELRAPLSSPAQSMTVALGLVFGASAASGAFFWGALVGLVAAVALLVLIALNRTKWSLAAVGSEWGRAQWLSFGASFALLMVVTVLLARTSFNSPLVGIVGGILVAVPLVIAAFKESTIRERPEEFWDASAPQS
ncbi:hypothetical protein GCM10022381_17490 [Leifsonia kafniensis]|uniref:Integral membrane protein n=1 Tax=Leifsonia kafniensis TaxID=475957 RepID=A0ABP7KF11_9MICO